MAKSHLKIFGTLLAATYFFYCARTWGDWHFIDSVNLIIHEAGHWIFLPFGQFLAVAGGSLLQVIIPLLFAAYFWKRNDGWSAGIVLMWAGQSLANVARYAADALAMELPLLGGDSTIHDWNWLLVMTGQLRHTHGIANTILTLGILLIITGTAWSLLVAIRQTHNSKALI